MFAPGLLSMIVSLALSSASNLPNIEQQALDAAKSVQQSVPAVVAPKATPHRMVMTWIPSYAIGDSLKQLKALHGGAGPSKALTHIGLQFWQPTKAGGVTKDGDAVSDAKIKEIVAWAHPLGIKILLCVYNASSGDTWDWDLAKSAFAGNRDAFVTALIAEMNRLKLDGVDIDFEGDDPPTATSQLNKDKPAYVAFVTALHAKLHKAGKQLTVDSFSDQWNAPNWTWWSALFPYVDGLTSMGYDEIGMNAAGSAKYSNQVAHAGTASAKLMLGMPSWVDNWQGNDAVAQTNWLLTHKNVSASIWDAEFTAPEWQKARVWQNLQKVRGAP
jgi:hypothetical protein